MIKYVLGFLLPPLRSTVPSITLPGLYQKFILSWSLPEAPEHYPFTQAVIPYDT